MEFSVLLMIGEADAGTEPAGLGRVGGISLLERQVRTILKKGARRVWVLAADLPEDLAERLTADDRCQIVPTARALAARTCRESAPILFMAPGLLIDDRLIAATLDAAEVPALLAFAGDAPDKAERLDADSCWGGIALLPAVLVTEVTAGLGDWDLASTLIRKAAGAGARRIIIEDIPVYAPERRRDAPMIWAMPETARDKKRATDSLLAAAQKGCLDWPARFIHPPVENGLVRLFLETPVSPNGVTLLTAVLGALSIALFILGQPLWALIILLVVGPLDGVDGKLARVRHQFSRWGDLEHVLDKIVEYGAILALAWWLARDHGAAAWLVAGGIIVFALVEALNGEFFRRFTGRQLDDWGPFERRFRLIGGRRNTFFWTLLPFGIIGQWWLGFLIILAYSAVTFGISHWRFCRAIGEYGRQVSPDIEKNFAATAYDFLPKTEPEAS